MLHQTLRGAGIYPLSMFGRSLIKWAAP